MRSASEKRWLALAPALALAVTLSACERKAPGPEECVAFADFVMTQTPEARVPRSVAHAKHSELVRTCLSTPYDDELFACVRETYQYRLCQRDFAVRRELERRR